MTDYDTAWYARLSGQAHGWIYLDAYLDEWLKKSSSSNGLSRTDVVSLLATARRVVELDSSQLRLFIAEQFVEAALES